MSKDEEELLVQGLKDYVDARNAVTAFRELIQAKCRRAVEDDVHDYAAALGITPSDIKCRSYKWSDGSEFNVGVHWFYDDIGADISHCVAWSPRNDGGYDTSLVVGLWSHRKNTDLLREAMRKHDIPFDGENGNEICLIDVLTPEDAGNIDLKLTHLNERWMNMWRTVGGIKAISVIPE